MAPKKNLLGLKYNFKSKNFLTKIMEGAKSCSYCTRDTEKTGLDDNGSQSWINLCAECMVEFSGLINNQAERNSDNWEKLDFIEENGYATTFFKENITFC